MVVSKLSTSTAYSEDGGTPNTFAALLRLPVSTTLLKYRIARS